MEKTISSKYFKKEENKRGEKRMSKEKKKQVKREKGITLVALVITVVVMLILAGVAIAAVVDGDGLFSKTRQAAETYENATDKESYMLENLMGQIDHYIEGGTSSGGNDQESGEGSPIASVVEVGDFVNYDAGTWNQSTDTSKIQSSGGTVTWSSNLSKSQGQFGGFTNGQSRNSNSTPYSTSYTPDYSGWRVWDIDESTGEITLISAGHPETYYHASGGNAQASKNILRNRDWSMYENEYAKSGSAEVLTKEEFDRWYKKYIDSSVDDTYDVSTFPTASEQPLITLAENGSYYWLASSGGTINLSCVLPNVRFVSNSYGYAYGVRVLVSLESDVQVKQGTATEGVTTWDIVGN